MLNLSRQQTNVFLILIVIIIVLSAILVKENLQRPSLEQADENNKDLFEAGNESKTDDPEIEKIIPNIKIYITGQIKYPGVIELKEGSRLIDAIELAGGMLEAADRDRINLALKVQDEGMYIIPKIGEQIDEELIQGADGSSGGSSKININTASLDDLQTLNGIGPAKAEAIITYRENQGLFESIEDLKKVSGIGDKIFEQLQDSITVG